jgi:hypothetical protein
VRRSRSPTTSPSSASFCRSAFLAIPLSLHADLAAALADDDGADARFAPALLSIYLGFAVSAGMRGLPDALLNPRVVARLARFVTAFCGTGGDAGGTFAVLSIFTAACFSHAAALAEGGALGAVSRVLTAFPDSARMVGVALQVVLIASGHMGEKMTSGGDAPSRALLGQTIAAGWEHKGDAAVALAVTGTLWNLARVRHEAVVNAKGLPLLLALMREHAGVAEVQEQGAVALRYCLHSWEGPESPAPVAYPAAAAELLAAGGLAVVLVALGEAVEAAGGGAAPSKSPAKQLAAATQVVACLSRGASASEAATAVRLLCTLFNRCRARAAAADAGGVMRAGCTRESELDLSSLSMI